MDRDNISISALTRNGLGRVLVNDGALLLGSARISNSAGLFTHKLVIAGVLGGAVLINAALWFRGLLN